MRATTDAAAATRSLYERYSQRVFTFCMSRLRDVEEAQDASQTTFVYALRALDRGVEPRFELAWLLAIAQNVCRSTRRSLDRRGARMSYVDVTELEVAAESMHAESGEELVWLKEALERLPENQRRAILLREWQGLSYADIADELELSLAAVEALLFRARRSLAARLERAKRCLRAVDPTALGLALRKVADGAALKATSAGVCLAVATGPLPASQRFTVSAATPRASTSVAGTPQPARREMHTRARVPVSYRRRETRVAQPIRRDRSQPAGSTPSAQPISGTHQEGSAPAIVAGAPALPPVASTVVQLPSVTPAVPVPPLAKDQGLTLPPLP